MDVNIVQLTPEFGIKQHNLQRIMHALQRVQADIIVLPELCTTGCSFLSKEETMSEAEDLDGETATCFGELSVKLKAVIIAGFVEKEEDKVYNSTLIALPNGTLQVCRKTNLSPAELQCFDEGNTRLFTIKHPLVDCAIGIMACHHQHYREVMRTLSFFGADIIVCPANHTQTPAPPGLQALAKENAVCVAISNRCGTEIRDLDDGTEQAVTFNGSSALYDYNGKPIAQAGKERDCVISASINLLHMRAGNRIAER